MPQRMLRPSEGCIVMYHLIYPNIWSIFSALKTFFLSHCVSLCVKDWRIFHTLLSAWWMVTSTMSLIDPWKTVLTNWQELTDIEELWLDPWKFVNIHSVHSALQMVEWNIKHKVACQTSWVLEVPRDSWHLSPSQDRCNLLRHTPKWNDVYYYDLSKHSYYLLECAAAKLKLLPLWSLCP